MKNIPPEDGKNQQSPGLFYLGLIIWGISIFGIRDVVITPLLRSILGKWGEGVWLTSIFWLSLFLSSLYLIWYLWVFYKTNKVSIPLKEFGIGVLLVSPYLYIVIKNRLFLDYWLDEMISIIRHILPSVSSAVLFYPVPNNHIFSNLLSGIYLQVFGWQDLRTILENPELLRIPYLIASIFAMIILAVFSYLYKGKWAGRTALVLFSTTIPLLNFSSQIRGYAITFLITSGLLYLIWSFIQDQSVWKAVWITILSALLLYTIPSNIYFLIAMIGFGLFEQVRSWFTLPKEQRSYDSIRNLLTHPLTLLVFIIFDGVVIGTLFYLPVLDEVLGNQYVVSRGFFRGTVFANPFQNSIRYFISGRVIVMIIAAVGFIIKWIRGIKEKDQETLKMIHLIFWAVLIPYVLSFIRGDQPFPRTFLFVFPAFLFAAAIGISTFLKELESRVSQTQISNIIAFTVVVLLCYVPFFQEYAAIRQQIRTNLLQENIDYIENNDTRMWASHFLEDYRVLDVAEILQKNVEDLPVLILQNDTRYEWVVQKYFQAFGISYEMIKDVEKIEPVESYIVVSYPERSVNNINLVYPGSECTLVTDKPSLYTLHQCIFTDQK